MENPVKNEISYPLRSCVWEITLQCCFSCRYCGSKAGKARENELTTEECLDVARQLAALGCRRVSMIGGEVFLRPDWAQIVQALTSRGVKVSIITNGFLFSETLIAALQRLNIESVAISLDGPESIHDAFRQPGSFRRAMDAVAILTGHGIPVSIITTLHSQNVPHLEQMYALLQNTKIFAWQIQACSPMGNAGTGAFSTAIDFDAVISFVERHRKSAPFCLGIADNIGYYTQTEGYLRGNPWGEGPFLGCRAGLTNIGIDSVGNVRGCESLYDDAFIEGNLRQRRLADIWNDPNAFPYNRRFTPAMLTGACAHCPHGSICAGGCRSYNHFSHGKLYESRYCPTGHKRK